MDKKSAIHLIESTFNAKFSEEQFTVFAKNLLNDLEQGEKVKSYSGNYIWDDYKEHINSYKRIGKYIDPNGEALDVLIVQVESSSKLERARTTLRNFIIKHLDKFEKDYALVAFYSNEDSGVDWRFSFVKLEHQSYFDEEKGKVKNKKEFTPAKRYSFLVGEHEKAHTAKNQILPLLQNVANNPTVEQLEDAFSIERVTDEFFEQYKDLYTSLSAHFENDSHTKSALEEANIENDRFTKKLLGQIVFLYFLQKKGWLGVPKNEPWGKGKKNFVQELFNQSEKGNENFFKDKLQFLFYEALAKERDNENSYYPKFDCRIPFLNGGLFEADYKWKEANISIPSHLFRNQDKNKSGDTGTGVLDVFDRYNFTIKEDEPLDKEVAVDPEMLGKVFENMLPENERKGKGAFYTPREIVHYMCQESLIHYLENSLGDQVSDTDIKAFIKNGHLALENDIRVADKGESKTYKYQLPQGIRNNAELIDQKLCDVRICDPAIGSGAFPVGLLHEIVTAMLILKPHFSLDYMKSKLDSFGFTVRESVNESRYVYRLKRHIIQESIYGVDIDASAIDIARLRLWLSLVVDEDDLDPIETLPNLDYKIVCGDSLIGLPENAMHDLKVENELEELKESFYNETRELEKKNLRSLINSKIRELLDSAEQFSGYHIDFDYKLYFSEVWHQNKGFDIVIGNPPYIQLQDKQKINPEKLKIYSSQNFETFEKSGDIYSLFYEKGVNITRKNSGVLTYITSNRFCFTNYGKSTRTFLSEKRIKALINLNEVPIFREANVGTIIAVVENKFANASLIRAGEFKDYNKNSPFNDQVLKYTEKLESHFYSDSQWTFYGKDIMEVKNKIITKGTPLGFLSDLKINRGITTGLNKVFLIKRTQAEKVFKQKESFDILKPVFKGAEIKRWHCLEPDNYLFYTYTGIQLEKYPEVLDFLSQFKDSLSQVYEAKKGSKKWYELRRCTYYNSFDSQKIIWTRLSNKNSFAISNNGEFSIDSTSFATGRNLKYYCTVLNSSIVFFYFKLGGVIWGKDGIKWFGDYFDKIPVVEPNSRTEHLFDNVYDYLSLLSMHSTSSTQFEFFERFADIVVISLYFEKEIGDHIVELWEHISNLRPLTNLINKEENLAIINSEFERLYSPKHPVRYAIETISSIEEVRIIKESLR